MGYIRVSTTGQIDGISLDAQREEILAYCIASNIEVIGIAADEGISGGKDDEERPGLRQVIEAVAAGSVDCVVVYKRDRLARDLNLAGYVSTKIKKHGAELIVLDEIDVPPLTRCVMAMVAEVERILASQRTKMALKALKERGRHVGVVPYGYLIMDGVLHPNTDETEVVDEVVRMRQAGRTLTSIAQTLTARAIPTRRGGQWSAEQVRSILRRAMTSKAAIVDSVTATESVNLPAV